MNIGRITCATLLSITSTMAFAHPGPPHTHLVGDELLHLLPVVAAIAFVIWLLRRNSSGS